MEGLSDDEKRQITNGLARQGHDAVFELRQLYDSFTEQERQEPEAVALLNHIQRVQSEAVAHSRAAGFRGH
jgi:hypothetical protein